MAATFPFRSVGASKRIRLKRLMISGVESVRSIRNKDQSEV